MDPYTRSAEYLGIHIETMRRWARKGVIPAAKLGNRGGFRFKREDLDCFLEQRRGEVHEVRQTRAAVKSAGSSQQALPDWSAWRGSTADSKPE
jgi:excisionase family DNA binding protein